MWVQSTLLTEGVGGSAGEIVQLYREPGDYVCTSFEWYCHFVNAILDFNPYFQNTLQHRFMAGVNTSWRSCVWRLYQSTWRPWAMNEDALVEKTCLLYRNIKVNDSVSGSTLKIPQQKQLARQWMFLLAGAIPSASGGSVRRDPLSGGSWSLPGAAVGASWGLVPAQRMGKAAATCTLRDKPMSRGALSQTSCLGGWCWRFNFYIKRSNGVRGEEIAEYTVTCLSLLKGVKGS